MSRNMLLAISSALMVGLFSGFAIRPMILPCPMPDASDAVLASAPSVEPRGTQYFVAHIDEARRVVAKCREGSVRGGECANANEAIIKVEAAERRKRFLGH